MHILFDIFTFQELGSYFLLLRYKTPQHQYFAFMRLLAFIVTVFLCLTFVDSIRAAHIVGGEAYYTFVRFNNDSTRVTYNIEFVMYRDSESNGAPFDAPAEF